MAREINPEKLDQQDKLYLRERPWLLTEFKAKGFDLYEEVWKDTPYLQDPTLMVTTEEASLGNSERRLPHVALRGDVPVEEQLGEPPMGEFVDDEPYENWTVSELQAEIDARNEKLPDGEHISRSGKKDELVQRLYESDQRA